MTDLYRVKYGISSGAASWGDWKYYEGRNSLDQMKADLLIAFLDVSSGWRGAKGSRLRLLDRWRKHVDNGNFGTYKDDYLDKRVNNIFAIEKRSGEDWLPVEVEFIAPEVIVHD